MPDLGYRVFDADNHYYEAEDAFTRHLPKGMGPRAMQWAVVEGRKRLLGRRAGQHVHPEPHVRPRRRARRRSWPSSRARQPGGDIKSLFGELEPIRPEYRDRDARLAVMDGQGLDACWLFPTLGVGMEEALRDDPEACVAAFQAFNRWLDDDWGFAYRDRIYAAPYFTLVDLDAGDRRAGVGARPRRSRRSACGRPGRDTTRQHAHRSPRTTTRSGRGSHEAGVTVAFHGGDGGYGAHVRRLGAAVELPRLLRHAAVAGRHRQPGDHRDDGRAAVPPPARAPPSHPRGLHRERIGVGEVDAREGRSRRHPDPRLVPATSRATRSTARCGCRRSGRTTRWTSAETIGVERTLFGSDWPHTEGLARADRLCGCARRPARPTRCAASCATTRPS